MKIPAILKGDTPQSVPIVLGAIDESSQCLVVTYRGVTRRFYGLTGGETKMLQFSTEETSRFPLGTDVVHMRLEGADGNVRTLGGDVRIKVTDCPAEVYDAALVVGGDGVGVSDLKANDSLGDVKSAVNGILNYLRGGASALLLAIGIYAQGASPMYSQLDDIPGNVPIMTNVESYVQGAIGSIDKSMISDGTNTINADLSVTKTSEAAWSPDVAYAGTLRFSSPRFDDDMGHWICDLAIITGGSWQIVTTTAMQDENGEMVEDESATVLYFPPGNTGNSVRTVFRAGIETTKLATTNEVVTAVETNMTLAGFDGSMNTMVIRPPAPTAIIPGNQWRVMKLGDDRTVTYSQYSQYDKMLVSAPSNLYFTADAEVSGGVTNYTLMSFQDYLAAASPAAVSQLLGAYLPTNGGGRVTGVLEVEGNLSVSGTFEGPNVIRIRSSDIEANGFTVSNGVVRANSGLVVSNGMCTINCARALNGIGTTRLHVEGGAGNVTFGGTWDEPNLRLPQVVTNLVENVMHGDNTLLADCHGPFHNDLNRVARLIDFATFGRVNAAPPIGENNDTPSRSTIQLRNGCVNVPTTALTKTNSLAIYFPYTDPSARWDMTQRSSFGIYFSSAPAAANVSWDYAPADGGFNLVGETGDELTISAGDLLWFQQIGTNTLSVTKKNYSHTLSPTRVE